MDDTKTRITSALRGGLVSFSYRKADGSVRAAIGTLHEDYLPKRDPDAAPGRTPPDDAVVYWDRDAGGFRQFKVGAIVNMPTPFTPGGK